ncbi:MAG TPA: hypothetical protein VGQ44_01795 [Gemmatimonadaceae bacterium]|nr:hypothetical protein [Gemmatimonadaceae bacterium]
MFDSRTVSSDSRLALYAEYAPRADQSSQLTAAPHLTASLKRQAEEKRYWPYFTLGGGLIGGGAVAGLAIANCHQDCQDDGSLSFLPGYVAAGAAVGAAVGTVIGLIVDASRSSGP